MNIKNIMRSIIKGLPTTLRAMVIAAICTGIAVLLVNNVDPKVLKAFVAALKVILPMM